MFQVRITNNYTQESIEANDCTLREALRLVNVAFFAAGRDNYCLSASIKNVETGATVPGYWED